MIARVAALGLPLALVVAGLLAPAVAEAAPPNPTLTDKKVRIHVGTDFFGWTHYNPDGGGDDAVNVLGFGFGRLTGIDRGEELIGLGPSVLSLGAGGVILQGRAVVGGQVAMTVDGIIPEEGDSASIVAGRLIPYFNYMFGPFGRWRPFVGLRFGFGGAAYEGPADPITGDSFRINTIYPIVGVQGGAHAFLADAVSLDLGLTIDYAAPHVKVEDEDFDKAGDWLNFAIINVGLSAWF